jgi:hypothetical protein
MPNPEPGKQKGSRKGCLIITLTISFVIASGFYFLTAGVRDAKRIEQTLVDRFGWAEEYTPPFDGSIELQRIEAFIRVREAVQPDCVDYQAVLMSINDLDKLETDQESSPSEAASTGLQGLKSAFSAGPRMIEFSTTRNQALLAQEMGLGEYLYIYLTTYGEQLSRESNSEFSNMEEAYVSERARKEYVQILANQLLALQAAEQQPSNPAMVADLRAEIEVLTNGSHNSPWPGGQTGKARESLAPYHQHLTGLYCSGIVKIELLQKNRGFQLEG